MGDAREIKCEADVRILQSRKLIEKQLERALGVYMKKEPKCGDSWRDMEAWQLEKHLKHEIGEIFASKTTNRKIHNALDAVALAAMLAAYYELKAEKEIGDVISHSEESKPEIKHPAEVRYTEGMD